MAAGQNTGPRHGFKPGELPPVGHPPWKKGESGNPGGRPKKEPQFRQRCREVAEGLLERMMRAPPEDMPKLVAAFEAIADRGGYCPADREAKMLMTIIGPQNVDPEQARALVASWVSGYGLGEKPAELPAVPAAEEEQEE